MKNVITSILSLAIVCVGLVGCGEKSTSKTETRVTTPGGETTTTVEKDVKQTGQNPPPPGR
jgi:predicted small lipoprotein YifL